MGSLEVTDEIGRSCRTHAYVPTANSGIVYPQLRMVRRGCARLILEDGMGVVYHCMDNARVHHGNALRYAMHFMSEVFVLKHATASVGYIKNTSTKANATTMAEERIPQYACSRPHEVCRTTLFCYV